MFGRRKLKKEIVRLNYRVAELEERLCPCKSHDWKIINTRYDSIHPLLDLDAINTYKCKTCGKTKEVWE